MQDKYPFKYAIIRLVPKVEREEFFNIGAILYCKRKKFLEVKFEINQDKLNTFSPEIDQELLTEYLNAWTLICEGHSTGGPIGALEISERFGWLTACRSTIIQSSQTHAGLCTNPEKELNALFKTHVL